MIRLALAPLLLLVAAPAWADVPEMAVEATCAILAEELGQPELLSRCLSDEAAALAALESHWAELPLDVAGGCTAATLEAGQPSYQILTLCIEDGLRTAGLPSPFPTEAP